jgi:predicted enzyme related to lactoylglutathione lyase
MVVAVRLLVRLRTTAGKTSWPHEHVIGHVVLRAREVSLIEANVRLMQRRETMTNGRMGIKYHVVMFDAADLATESGFWAGVLDGTVKRGDGWHIVLVDNAPVVGVQLVPNYIKPEWPDGVPQQIHLDFEVEDLMAAHEEVVSLGAKLLKPADDIDSSNGFQVYADPAGHPFCLCWTKAK